MTDTQELVVPKSIPITSPPAGLELKALGPTAHLLEKRDALEPWDPFKWVEAWAKEEETTEATALDLKSLERRRDPIAIAVGYG